MSDILDDWFGFDPPPSPPTPTRPAPAAPATREPATQTSVQGVDATRRLTGTSSSSRTGRSSFLIDPTGRGVGLNV